MWIRGRRCTAFGGLLGGYQVRNLSLTGAKRHFLRTNNTFPNTRCLSVIKVPPEGLIDMAVPPPPLSPTGIPPPYRIEHDSLGVVEVPHDAPWGAQTERALQNFSISGYVMPGKFLQALGLIKACAAKANNRGGVLTDEKCKLIEEVAMKLYQTEELLSAFPVDVFQTGSGTSSNMNANEVIAHLANQKGIQKDENGKPLENSSDEPRVVIHPNDDVNMSQSSNDVIPTTTAVAAVLGVHQLLLPALDELLATLEKRAKELDGVCKTGRTHLMDAVPLTFGQEIRAWTAILSTARRNIILASDSLSELAIGGTAIGTGLNAPPNFAKFLVEELSNITGMEFKAAENSFELMSAQDRLLALNGTIKVLASGIMKISNDLRWMNSGPLSGLKEIRLPAVQPGSSIMPGKVNPVICESAMMVCCHIMGSDTTMTMAASLGGQFQLHTMLPLMAFHALENIRLISKTMLNLSSRVIAGFEVTDNSRQTLSTNPILATALNTTIGYERGAKIVKRALAENRAVLDVAVEECPEINPEKLAALLDPLKLTGTRQRDNTN